MRGSGQGLRPVCNGENRPGDRTEYYHKFVASVVFVASVKFVASVEFVAFVASVEYEFVALVASGVPVLRIVSR